ncbi:MAG: hypothetical protein VX289_05460 [Candidatus Poribacteria bacterium]|nr:hypothetical protein [Candidatus Poribacteria bacterium]
MEINKENADQIAIRNSIQITSQIYHRLCRVSMLNDSQKIDNWLEFNQVPVFVNGHQIVTE